MEDDMDLTRDVVTDLLPLYFSGEASADTHALVEAYFARDPEFEQAARRLVASVTVPKSPPASADDEQEKRTLIRARSLVRKKNLVLGFALASLMMLLLWGGAAIVYFTGSAALQRPLLLAVPIVVAVVCWVAYFVMSRRSREIGL
jgi:ferric-dicitrate binding protein FerR (iron transport regulator)